METLSAPSVELDDKIKPIQQITDFTDPEILDRISANANAELDVYQESPEPLEVFSEAERIEFCQSFERDMPECLHLLAKYPTGFPVDALEFTDNEIINNGKTSPTNIGLQLASLIAMHDLGAISIEEAKQSVDTILTSLKNAVKYKGLFYGWYDPETGNVKDIAGEKPFISTVDNAWLAVGLITLKGAMPNYAEQVDEILEAMRFSILFDEKRKLYYNGFDPVAEKPTTGSHYGIRNTEARITNYIGTIFGIPEPQYLDPDTYRPPGYIAPPNADKTHSPTWQGGMFEPVMPTLFLDKEDDLGPSVAGHIEKQVEFGKKYNDGYFGISPAQGPGPNGEYKIFGIPDDAVSDDLNKKIGNINDIDSDFHVITPHASFICASHIGNRAIDNLMRLKKNFPNIYEEGVSFFDSVNVKNGMTARTVLSLNQSMGYLGYYNGVSDGQMTKNFAEGLRNTLFNQDSDLPVDVAGIDDTIMLKDFSYAVNL